MNILYFLTPKSETVYLTDDMTVRQALEKTEACSYAALPMLDRDGRYVGAVTEGDLLWYLKKRDFPNLRETQHCPLTDVPRRTSVNPVRVYTTMDELVRTSLDQNFVPVLDDRDSFIGIVTRKSILQYYFE